MTELQEVARQVYDQARRHYKGGVKGANKEYDPQRAYPPAMAAKVATRAANAAAFMAAHATAPNPQVLRGAGMSFLGAGNVLLATGNTYGQCSEMSAVASALFYRLSRAPINIAITMEYDHAFVVIGARPPVCRVMSDLARAPRNSDCWAVDVWAGVFCHASEYLARFHKKMLYWQAQGKLVSVGTWRQPTWAYMGLDRSRVMFLDPRHARASL